MKRKALLVPVLAAIVLSVLSAGQAQAGQPAKVAAETDVGVQDVQFCDGGAQKRVFVRTDSVPFPLVENGAWAPVPGMVVNFVVPDDSDHILVQYSAEAQIINPGPGDQILIRTLLDGVPMEGLVNDQIFNTDSPQSNAVQACKRVGMGNHTVRVEYWLQDLPAFVALNGLLDGQALTVQQSE